MTDNVHNQLAVLDTIASNLPAAFRDNYEAEIAKYMGGIQASFPILTIKGKTWGIRYRGTTTDITAPNHMAGGQLMPVQFLDVVIVDSADTVSKVYYASGFKENERTPPDCWSVNGITPDPASANKQSNTCRGCRHNVFGSKIGDAGQKGKACPDNKRLAIVPAHDLRNEAWGGPMMLRLPPASFNNWTSFLGMVGARHIAPAAVVVRLTFDQSKAFPCIVFTPVRAVTPQEADVILDLRNNPQIKHMLTDAAVGALADAGGDEDVPGPAQSPLAPPPAAMVPPPVQQVQQPVTPPGNVAPGGWGAPPPVQQQAAPPPVAQPAAPTVAPPPGVSPEEWAILQRMRNAGAGTPIVTPEPPAPPPATLQGNDPGPIPPFLVRQPATPPAPAQEQAAAAPPAAATGVPMTPEQLRIAALEKELEEARAAKARKPRAKPVAPPTDAAPAVTPVGNGADGPSAIGTALADRIAGLVKA